MLVCVEARTLLDDANNAAGTGALGFVLIASRVCWKVASCMHVCKQLLGCDHQLVVQRANLGQSNGACVLCHEGHSRS